MSFPMLPTRQNGEPESSEQSGRGRLDLSHTLIEGITAHAIFMTDADNRILTWNHGVQHILGYSRDEWVGRDASVIFTPEDLAAGVLERETAKARAEGQAEDIRWHVKKDGTRFYADGFLTPLYGESGGDLIGYGKVLRDATARKSADDAIRERDARFQAVAQATKDAVWDWDLTTNAVTWNEGMLHLFGYGSDALFSDAAWWYEHIHPDDRERIVHGVHAVIDGGGNSWSDEYRYLRADGSYACLLDRGYVVRDEAGKPLHMVGAMVDISERVGRERRERFLAELAFRIQTLTDPNAVIADVVRSLGGFLGLSRCTFVDIDQDADTCDIRLNYCANGVASIAGVLPWSSFGPAVGRELAMGQAVVVNDVHADPERVPPEHAAAYDGIGVRAHVTVPSVHSARVVSVISAQSATPRRWTPDEVSLLQTVVERTWLTVEVARQQHALRENTQRERALLTEIFTQAPAFMAALRGPDHVFELANPPYYQLVGHRDLVGRPVSEALPEVVEQGFVGLLDRVYRTGEPFIGKDLPIRLQTTPDAPLEERFVDFTYQPLFGEGGAVTGILAHGIDRTKRKRLEQERERLLAAAQARAERESLVNQIGEAARGAMESGEVLTVTVEKLGTALGADRCYYVSYDPERDSGRIGPDWHRGDLSPISGDYRMSDYAVNRETGYRAGQTQVIADVHEFEHGSEKIGDAASMTLMDRLGLRALIRAPVHAGSTLTALVVAMAHGSRQWTDDEVRLVETVAAQTRAAVETARVQQRERNIALQLQDALVPPAPPPVPGLALASFYRPALEEAGVGGDFFDVFSVGEGCTALVVGDLSGKGLQAASQVATVRNMLRLALYTGRTVEGAITTLHDALVEHDLLTGFATLFVGIYEESARTITYVNCGQEPGLIWHAATGEVEQLDPTGPVLGGYAQGVFTRETVCVEPGDVFALFTDGLTEVGETRRTFLEVEGVVNLLRGYCAKPIHGLSPQAVVDYLVAGVDRFGGKGVRDDIALLVGVVGTAGDSSP